MLAAAHFHRKSLGGRSGNVSLEGIKDKREPASDHLRPVLDNLGRRASLLPCMWLSARLNVLEVSYSRQELFID